MLNRAYSNRIISVLPPDKSLTILTFAFLANLVNVVDTTSRLHGMHLIRICALVREKIVYLGLTLKCLLKTCTVDLNT